MHLLANQDLHHRRVKASCKTAVLLARPDPLEQVFDSSHLAALEPTDGPA